MDLNERIASVRKAAGLTQEQLGELVDVSRQAVSKWESGQAGAGRPDHRRIMPEAPRFSGLSPAGNGPGKRPRDRRSGL